MEKKKSSEKAKKVKTAKPAKKSAAKRVVRRKPSPRENRQGYLAKATLKHVRISPRKLRLALDLVRGKQVDQALQVLKYNPRKGSAIVSKVLLSAIANAKERAGADVDKLWVSGGSVEQGPVMMRYMPAAQGRATPIRKRSSHLTVQLDQR